MKIQSFGSHACLIIWPALMLGALTASLQSDRGLFILRSLIPKVELKLIRKEYPMNFETFELERIQSLYENTVQYNLTESGIHPYTPKELLSEAEIDTMLNLRLGYGQTNGSIELRNAISRHYQGADMDNVLVTNGSAESNFTFAWSNIQAGDEVVVMLPN